MSNRMLLNEIPVEDTQYREYTITEVRETTNTYQVCLGVALWIDFSKPTHDIRAPQVGDCIRLYGRGSGYRVRGVVVAGVVFNYLTEEEDSNRQHEESLQHQEDQARDFLQSVADRRRRIAALPKTYRDRIRRFQRDGGINFRIKHEDYELFCCEQAVIISDTLESIEAISAFSRKTYEEQRALVPQLSDDHSGNTLSVSVALAKYRYAAPDLVIAMHGALTPLVGCDEYGCKHENTEGARK